jgi:tetratricopeptide (TPR) repeat protein
MRLTTSEAAVTKIAHREGSRRQGPASIRLGERLRQLRVSAGLTQSDLAGERFSKEYVSQIERGKTRPTGETIEWLAIRLGVDPSFLASGVSADERGRMEATLTRAEALTEANEFDDALAEFEKARVAVAGIGSPELEARALSGEGWARLEQGDARSALDLFEKARQLVEQPSFSDVERAEVLYRLGVCRYKLSSVSTSLGLFNEALTLAERSGFPCDALRSNILGWRSRCYRRQRDWEAAREDVERALELAEGLNDRRTVAHVFFQASLIAERNGHWLLARTYAERAKGQYEELADQANVGKLLNNLGGLNFLLGKPEQAIEQLKDSFRVLLDAGSPADAAEVVSSLAQVHLRLGQVELAEQQARQALELVGDRPDLLDRIGNAQLVLGRALLEQGRLEEAEGVFSAAEQTCDQLESASHRAAAWIAQGDLASKRGNDRRAAQLYRRAAETLQDFRF